VDVFTDGTGSGNQAAQADHNVLGVLRSTDHGATWSAVITGPGIETIGVTDPDTGAPVRSGEPLTSVAVDPANGNLYAVWADGRFSNKFSNDSVALSMSTDGGLTWSDPIKINQTPTNIPAGNQQAFTPVVAVNQSGTVAVTYYDFRNNTAAAGLPTDYWLVHASGNFTDPSSWSTDEKQLTTSSFNMENAAPTSRGYFLGDYEGLAAAGNSFYALFAQAGADSSDPSNIFFRDPPPQIDVGADAVTAADAATITLPDAPAPIDLGADAVAVWAEFSALGNASDPAVLAGSNLPAAATSPGGTAVDQPSVASVLDTKDHGIGSLMSTAAPKGTAPGSLAADSLDSVASDSSVEG
jgi:hypothetical protein